MLNKIIEILISMFLLIPVFSVLHKTRFHNIQKTILYFVFATYLAAVYLFVGMLPHKVKNYCVSVHPCARMKNWVSSLRR